MAVKMTCVSLLVILLAVVLSISSADTRCTLTKRAKKNLKKLAFANNELAFNLLRELNTGSQNIFFSPFGISLAFGMLFYGSRGDTAEELRNVLGYQKMDLPDEAVHDTFNCFLTKVLKGDASSDEYILNSANAVLVDKNFELLPEYKNDVQDLYKALVRNVDFTNDSVEIVREINDWVKEKTNGKIKKSLKELNPSAIMVLLNTVYFKNIWKFRFKPEITFFLPFYNNGLISEKKNVKFMHMSGRFRFADFDDFKALELPNKGGRISMLILLPNQRNGLRDLEESLTHETLYGIQKRMFKTDVIIRLPKFKIRFEKELSPSIQALGINSIFRAGAANFSGISSSKSVFVDQVIHKAVVEVNEDGCVAPSLRINLFNSLPPEFYANHPFLFAIIEKGSKSNMVLLLGHVNKL